MVIQKMNKSEKFWDKRAKDYNNQKTNWEKYNKTVEKTKQYLNTNDIVLDFACGAGIKTIKLADNVKEIQGIDISSKLIDVAKRKAEERKVENTHFAQATIFDTGFKKESFDVILAFNILHLIDNGQEIIHKIHKLLKPGGLFISETVCMGEKKAFLGWILSFLSKIGLVPPITFLKISELEDLMGCGKFQIIDTEIVQQNPQSYYIVAKKE